jgi:hypothetical protein
MIKVKPGEGLIVRDPVTLAELPAKGKSVPRNAYWLRRLADGDVIEAEGGKSDKKEAR